MKEAMDSGISENNAAVACRGQTGNSQSDCMERLMYRELRAAYYNSMNGWYTFKRPPDISKEQMRAAGLDRILGSWGWNNPTAKVPIMSAEEATTKCGAMQQSPSH